MVKSANKTEMFTKNSIRLYWPISIVFLIGGVVIASISAANRGLDIGFEYVSLLSLIPPFLVGAFSASIMGIFYLKNRSLQNTRGLLQQNESVRLNALVEERTEELRVALAEKEVSESRYRDASRIANFGHWMWDEIEHMCIYCSVEKARIYGVSVEEFITTTKYSEDGTIWTHPDDKEMFCRVMREAIEQRIGYDLEYRIITGAGEIRHVREISSPVFDANGVHVTSKGTVQDITDHKHLEGQLRQSQRMEAVGQLTGGVAHDFNNLLGIMLGNAEMIEIHAGDVEQTKRNIDMIKKTVNRASSLTSRLLAFSRQQALSPVSANIADLVNGLDDMLKRTLGETIALSVEVDNNIWPATVDQHQFENALVNLAINGRDAMPNGGALTIRTSNVTLDRTFTKFHDDITPGDYVTVAVSDTGTGMTPEVLEKVFEPFFTTKDVGEGSGLGLSMVFGFIKQSDGHVTIYSEVDLGTTVKLYLPRSEEDIRQNGVNNETPKFAEGAGRILVVEDDENLRKVPVTILRDQGYQVVEAGNGEEAIKILSQDTTINMLFSDVVLPGGMNGVEISEKAVQLQPNILVLYASGYAQTSIMLDGKLVPGVNFLNKPYTRVALLEKVQAMLDNNGD